MGRGQIASRAGWYARRLRAMGGAEILWRVGQAAQARRPAGGRQGPDVDWVEALARFRSVDGGPVLLDRVQAMAVRTADGDGAAAVISAADQALDRRFQFFGYPEVRLTQPIDWNLDPCSGYRWPSEPARRIDHRTAPSDPKWIWELNRLQHLPWLAQAWLWTGEERYAEGALEHLDSWLAQNPPGTGIAWRGGFEVGIRAISIAVALQGLRESDALTAERYRRLVQMLGVGAGSSWRQRSRFSSANNHLVGELVGVITVMLVFPELEAAAGLLDPAVAELSAQAALQILPDGAGAEQAVAYQVFTAELLLLAWVLLGRAGMAVPAEISAALARSADYLAALVADEDPDPRYGDGDDGFALRLGAEPLAPTVRAHLGTLWAATGQAADAPIGQRRLASQWLAAPPAPLVSAPAPAPSWGSRFAESGGLVVLRRGGQRITMDVGPLGYLATAAHGHADALAITLSADGRELVGDPGPASYYGHPEWRAAHRGTRAHATVCVDGVDQSVVGGAFLWTRKAQVRVNSVDLARGVVDAQHDGYQRLEHPVTHRRWLVAPEGWRELLVLDLIEGAGPHSARASWPLHPDLRRAPGTVDEYAAAGLVLQICCVGSAATQAEPLFGDSELALGWWSERLESRRPAWLASSVARGQAPLVLATVLDPRPAGGEGRISGLELSTGGGTILVSWRGSAGRRAVAVDQNLPGSVELRD